MWIAHDLQGISGGCSCKPSEKGPLKKISDRANSENRH